MLPDVSGPGLGEAGRYRVGGPSLGGGGSPEEQQACTRRRLFSRPATSAPARQQGQEATWEEEVVRERGACGGGGRWRVTAAASFPICLCKRSRRVPNGDDGEQEDGHSSNLSKEPLHHKSAANDAHPSAAALHREGCPYSPPREEKVAGERGARTGGGRWRVRRARQRCLAKGRGC